MIEIMDTTLRDGEQTSGVSFAAHEKLSIAQVLLSELKVDRLEIASARVSEGEFEAVKRVARWAERSGYLDKLEVLGFVDGEVSINWIESAGCRVINLLCKGSYKHVTEQLRKTPEAHIEDIKAVIRQATARQMKVNLYLEDWSNGIQDSPEYVFQFMDALKDEPVSHFMLPDTLGVLNPMRTFRCCRKMLERYPGLRFDFHAHNDYDLAVRPIPVFIFHPISRSLVSMSLRNAPVCMPMAIARIIFIATPCCLSVSDGFVSTRWARPPERRISARIWRRWALTSMRHRCAR